MHPEFVHDTFSSFYPLALISPVMRAMELEKHGLDWSHAPSVVGTPLAGGRWAELHRRAEERPPGSRRTPPATVTRGCGSARPGTGSAATSSTR